MLNGIIIRVGENEGKSLPALSAYMYCHCSLSNDLAASINSTNPIFSPIPVLESIEIEGQIYQHAYCTLAHRSKETEINWMPVSRRNVVIHFTYAINQ